MTSFTMILSDLFEPNVNCVAQGFGLSTAINSCSVESVGLTPSCVSTTVFGDPFRIYVTNCPTSSQFKLICQDANGATVDSEPIDLTGLNCHSIGQTVSSLSGGTLSKTVL